MKISSGLLLWLFYCLMLTPQAQRCLPSSENNTSERYFNFNGKPSNLNIGSTDRLTHNLTSNIFLILLTEVLGYKNVHIVDGRFLDRDAIRLLKSNNPENSTVVPKNTINLEVWTDLEFWEPFNPVVLNLGHIARPGRYGWFVRGRSEVCWQTFLNPDESKEFALNDTSRGILQSYCPRCQFTSQHGCDSTVCAALFIDENDPDLDAVEKHVDDFGLLVIVVPVPKLSLLVRQFPSDAPLLIATRHPNDITVTGPWHSVTFPSCDTEEPDFPLTAGCMYEPQRLNKLAAVSIVKGAKEAYETASRMKLTNEHVVNMMRRATDTNMTHYDVACEWVQKNTEEWEQWVSLPPLQICGIFPLDPGARFSSHSLPAAAQLAVDRVNMNPNILPNRQLHLSRQNGRCNTEMAMNSFIDFVLGHDAKELVGVLGPGCSDSLESLSYLTTHFRTAVISYSAEGSISSISERNKYPYFFRTIGENLDYMQVYLKFCQQMGWNRLGALSEDTLKYTEYLTHLQTKLRENGIALENIKFLKNHVNVSTCMKELENRRIKIIVADVHDAEARAIMCEAYRHKMTAREGYVWFLPGWLSKNWFNIEMYAGNSSTKENVTCTTREMREAIQGYFSLSHPHFADNNTVTHENITVKQWWEMYHDILLNETLGRSEASVFAGYAYDAVWTYALALDKLQRQYPALLSNIHSPNATTKYVEFIQNSSFVGVSGPISFPNNSPSRTSPIIVSQWIDNQLKQVGTYNNTSDELIMNMSATKWYTKDGAAPDDGGTESLCSLQGFADVLGTSCAGAIVGVNVLVFLVISAIVVAAFVFYKRKYDKRIGQLVVTEKYMRQLGFDVIPPVLSDLDKWEVPRECVVINRKLGEGAFGTVYGGEAKIDDCWVPAAVKTLKANSDPEEKLDFLGEAELMKRFDHQNIVKLLGVCTRNEPVYTIMEFMMHGDLRTFLQNRRHLVTGRHPSDESNEVSNKRLTSYALDIARGLSFLSSEKYVHRDIACRNCLLSSAKVAKISDFGLTRRMQDSDYYKFSRKGMLPIRWMSPESLADGLFTPKSDVWAFGVVLFEIVTFGSYPFPGLTNNQVMEHVKMGNCLNVPKGAKTQLESLMKSCWSIDKEQRPDPSDLVVFLANNPRVLSPCLESVPTSADLQPELFDRHLSGQESFDPSSGFVGVEEEEGEDETPSPLIFEDENDSLLPQAQPIFIQMTQRAPLASPSTSELDISSGNL